MKKSLAICVLAYCWMFTAYSSPALIPVPCEITFTEGTCPATATPKVERVDGIPAEGYELSVRPDGVTIRASDEAGEFYARQTMAQLSDATSASLSCCEIKDSPRFRWRGVHVDDVRHFLGKEQAKRTIDQISKYKFNVFHWHLTDDQAWRIEVPGYPKLASKGGCYTADDIREVVAYAAERHIRVVPEIDFPGHFRAVSRAYPAFSCDTGGARKKGGAPMCVGSHDAVKFVESALDAVCDLFPASEIIHIGGDECRRDYWKDCPKCKAMMEREGMVEPQDLPAWLTRHAVGYLAAKGRRAIGWDEMLDAKDGYLPVSAMGMRWHEKGAERTARAAAAGHEIVNCHKWFCYFDFSQELEGDMHRYFGMGRVSLPLEKVYAFDPLAELPEELHSKVIGGQCNNWTEVTYNGKDLEWKLWPRGFAMAEVLWTYPAPKKRDFSDFKRRAAIHRDDMVKCGVNAAPINAYCLAAESCLVEAEAFADKGGWVVDPQFVEQMGSPYLLAHGKGVPVADATTSVNIKPGRVRAYVRTRDWTPDWNGEKPGRFRLSLGGKPFPVVLGVAPATWGWIDAGVVEVGEGPQTLLLHDLTGFEGRCDAIYLCPEDATMPPSDATTLAAWRAEKRGESDAPNDVVKADFVIVGGGIAGTAAAIAAAEAGMSVAIVQDRPMLGGNASDEIRVLSCKKKDEYHWIVKAIQNGNPNNCYPSAQYDEKRMNLARSYPNIALHLGWRAYGVVTNAARRIVAVDARNVETGARRRFVAPLYCDAMGDGWIAYWAGAKYMLGREAKTEFDEPKAPDETDTSTMGNSVMWTTKEQEDDYDFPEVPWATKVSGTRAAIGGNWQWEAGLDPAEDTIDDAEMLRDRLFRAIYGAFWNAKQKSENSKRVFDWVAYIAGKRESRRIIGDYVVSERDVTERRQFVDAIGVATWGIDLHKKKGDSGFIAANDYYRVKPWWMPYRSLCCRDVPNLFLAGRCASYTHIAFASCRVQHALGQQGVAVGYAASLCKKYGCLPRGIHEDPVKTAELQALLNLKQSEKGMKPYKWPKSQPVAKERREQTPQNP